MQIKKRLLVGGVCGALLVSTMVRQQALSQEDIQALQDILDRAKGGNGRG